MARGRQLITSFTASPGRAITLNGVLYAAGAAIPGAVVASLRHASALLSNRRIIPGNAQYPGRAEADASRLLKPSPIVLGADERRNLLGL